MTEPPSLPRRDAESESRSARERQRAETRERLFEAALKEFREYGFAGAQIDRIARSAGVVRGTFYFHFPSKDDVLIELARRISARVARRVRTIGNSQPTLRQLLHRVNDAILDEHARVGEAGLLAELLSLYVRRPRDLQTAPDESAPSFAGELAGHLEAIRERGGIQPSMSTELASIVYMSSLFGITVRIPPGKDLRTACDALIDMLVAGMQAEDPSAPDDSQDARGSPWE